MSFQTPPTRAKRRRRFAWIAIFLVLGVSAGAAFVLHRNRTLEKKQASRERLFALHIAPTLEGRCLKCHGPARQEGDLRLDTQEAALLGGRNGPAIVTGDLEKSLIFKRICHLDMKRVMPPRNPLTDIKIAAFKKWILDGAYWPRDLMHRDVAPAPAEPIRDAWSDPRNPIVKLFGGKRLDLWSLKPVSHAEPPAVQNVSWPRNPVDKFILAKVESGNSRPAVEADRRTLARRLYFDLTGMPPTPQEIETFVRDNSPDAHANLVDKLLKSPEYGEHWGRYWLDVVHYSDSNGFDYDEFRPNAWRFRDYVIKSLNDDKPFDQFVREQLAGDEMVAEYPQTSEDQDRLIASAYLRIGPYDNSSSIFGERDLCHFQVMSDIVETTGAAFLGMTLSCSRCHDHKTDPISQADYYRLRAFFEGVVVHDDVPLDLPPKQQAILQERQVIEAKKQEIADFQESVEGRVRQMKIAALPASDRAVLEAAGEGDAPGSDVKVNLIRKLLKIHPEEVEAEITPEEKLQRAKLAGELKTMEGNRATFTAGFIATDVGHWLPQTHVFEKGDFRRPKDAVEPGIFSVLNPNPIPPAHSVRAHSSGRRTALADWILSPDNPLTARVIVNRIWQQHFGTGIVATPNDFGFSGSRPSHPELLDWLAREFVKEGWSLKKLHRLLLTSATYRQGLAEKSGDNSLFNGQAPRRLTAEALRDSLLSVSGLLLPERGGPPRWPALSEETKSSNPGLLVENGEKTRGWYPSPPDQVNVRTIYLVQKRSLHVPMLETFDQPENTTSCGRRNVSTVAPQALTLLNNNFTIEVAKAFASRVEKDVGNDPDAQIEDTFELALQRHPNAEEKASSKELLQQYGLASLCRVLVNLNEFIYVD